MKIKTLEDAMEVLDKWIMGNNFKPKKAFKDLKKHKPLGKGCVQ